MAEQSPSRPYSSPAGKSGHTPVSTPTSTEAKRLAFETKNLGIHTGDTRGPGWTTARRAEIVKVLQALINEDENNNGKVQHLQQELEWLQNENDKLTKENAEYRALIMDINKLTLAAIKTENKPPLERALFPSSSDSTDPDPVKEEPVTKLTPVD